MSPGLVRCLLLGLAFAACGEAQPLPESGTPRMAELLRRLADEADPLRSLMADPERRLAIMRERLASAPDFASKAQMGTALGVELLRAGATADGLQ